MQWDIPKLISEELRQPVRGAACGGTHRLAGLTLAYKMREQRGEPVDGEYLKAKKFTRNYQRYAYKLQNSDGSFSTEWFRGPGKEESIDRRLKTTGHILEWLLYAAGEKELKHRQTTRAANYLANIMYNNRYKDWEAGPLGHAVHALLLYDQKVFAPYDQAAQATASKGTRSSRSKKNRQAKVAVWYLACRSRLCRRNRIDLSCQLDYIVAVLVRYAAHFLSYSPASTGRGAVVGWRHRSSLATSW